MNRGLRLALAAIALGSAAAVGGAGTAAAQLGTPAPYAFGNPRIYSAFGNPMGVGIVNPNGSVYGYTTPDGSFYRAPAVPEMPLPPNVYYGSGGATPAAISALFGSPLIARASDTIDASIGKDNKLTIKWSGEPSLVSRIRFALLDSGRHVITEQTVTKLPAQAQLALTSKTGYYRVAVEYVNGTSTTVISPL